jgi:hypothetical protein
MDLFSSQECHLVVGLQEDMKPPKTGFGIALSAERDGVAVLRGRARHALLGY